MQARKLEGVESKETSNKEHSSPKPTSKPVAIVAHVEKELTGDNEGITSAQSYENVIDLEQPYTINLFQKRNNKVGLTVALQGMKF